jgi:hypothetical protein
MVTLCGLRTSQVFALLPKRKFVTNLQMFSIVTYISGHNPDLSEYVKNTIQQSEASGPGITFNKVIYEV